MASFEFLSLVFAAVMPLWIGTCSSSSLSAWNLESSGHSSLLAARETDILTFFSKTDASEITWAHAVNSEAALTQHLNDATTLMLEADVSFKGTDTNIPWMAHSETDESNINLDTWLQRVIEAKATAKKGIKLDFKSDAVAAKAFPILMKHRAGITFPFLLNADIISSGPADVIGSAAVDEARAEAVFQIGAAFPQCTLSVGWITSCPKDTCGSAQYTWEHIFAMAGAVVTNVTAPASDLTLTFPVRAAFINRSWKQFRYLLEFLQQRKASLTVWTNEVDQDVTKVEDLLEFRTHFPATAVYYDLFNNQKTAFDAKRADFKPTADYTDPKGLTSVIERIPAVATTPFIGTQSFLMRNGYSFRTKADYATDASDRFEFKATVYFGGPTLPAERKGRFLILLRPGLSTGAMQLGVSRTGKITLKECKRTEGSCLFSPENGFDGANWSLVSDSQINDIATDRIFTITVVDDVAAKKASFVINTRPGTSSHEFRLERTWNSDAKASDDVRNSPAVQADMLSGGNFIVVEDIIATHKEDKTSAAGQKMSAVTVVVFLLSLATISLF